ncbi:hypothetical protein BAUCODRAFT_124521 [Baudoinia panamericana UAMH 10762]|uniref:Uncharacterized protein n=1 Tax=Baudoinia panamericana (strain UAMH 10762) TaxID=717646 RepID=M2LHV4_BAUPA|nr:uncharacterized protein BAUCODRAFT_124521 [Baudoinia panamericana UAMH 10762]EMC93762.1 hypothetical protein BAUCODRAFT_124521 [Baudoinia panamericana UAMH 10762]
MSPAPGPHRKPLPGYAVPPPQQAYPRPPSLPSGPSSNGSSPAYSMTSQQAAIDAYGQSSRRTPSNGTISTAASTSPNPGLQRAPTTSGFSVASAPRRSTSSRSTSSLSPTSYVALMRRQKATVWCDRAQHEDPRILAAQRAAKTRAAMEVAGGHAHAPAGRVSTSSSGMVGGVRSKIRHHGAPKASTYTGGPNMTGAGVPMRLSASEVGGENDSDEDNYNNNRYHSRNGSGRSSLGSGNKGQHGSFLGSTRGYSNGSTPTSGHSPVESMGDLLEEETPVPDQYRAQADYFQQPGGRGGSGSSGEQEQQFGGVGGLPQTRGGKLDVVDRKTSDELRRRGSVDDRTTTMTGVRLFVANPDMDD